MYLYKYTHTCIMYRYLVNTCTSQASLLRVKNNLFSRHFHDFIFCPSTTFDSYRYKHKLHDAIVKRVKILPIFISANKLYILIISKFVASYLKILIRESRKFN